MTITTGPTGHVARQRYSITRSRPTSTIIQAGLIGGAATTSGIALTATSGWLIVRANERPVMLTLLMAIVAVRAFGMARPTFRYAERLRSHDAALGDLAHARQAVFATLIPLTPARLGRRAHSEVLTGVVDDLTDVVDAQVRVTVPVIASAMAGLLALGLTTALWPPVGAVLAGLLLVLAAGCWVAWRLESTGRDDVLTARAQVARVSDLVARQADEVRAVGGEQRALRWLDEAHCVLRDNVRRQSHGRALVSALLLAATGIATLLAAWLALNAAVSAPVKALLIVVPVATGDALVPLVEAMRSRATADGATSRLDALLGQRPAVAARTVSTNEHAMPPPRPTAPTLRLRALTASWTGTVPDLGPIDLDITPGQRLAIIGANGSGKSTLLAVLARQLDPLAGSYTIDATDALTADLAQTRALFALLDDEPHIFASTLAANLRVAAPDADDGALHTALASAGLTTWAAELPDGLDTRLGTGGRGLSGGERTRLGLARAILSQRPVLLLDEPLAQLDHATAQGIMDDLCHVGRGTSIVMVSHRPEGRDRFGMVLDLSPTTARKEI